MGNAYPEIRHQVTLYWLSTFCALVLSSCSISPRDSSHFADIPRSQNFLISNATHRLPNSPVYQIDTDPKTFFISIEMCTEAKKKYSLQVYMRQLLVGHKNVTLVHNETFDSNQGKALLTAGYSEVDGHKNTLCLITVNDGCLRHYVWWRNGHLNLDGLNSLIQLASKQAKDLGI